MSDIFFDEGPWRATLPYLEGFPSMIAAEAADALATGHTRCVWNWSDNTRYRHCDIEQAGSANLWLSIGGNPLASAVEAPVCVSVSRATNSNEKRPFALFQCPRCGSTRRALFFGHAWVCRECSGVPYRSQRISAKVRDWEKRDQLDTLVRAGRPKGMHEKTFVKRRQELALLERKLGDERASAPREYLLLLKRRWIRPGSDS